MTASTSTTPFELLPVAGRIGAEVRGLRLGAALQDSALAALRAALLRHKVLFLRGQHLDDAEHEDFGRRLGALVAHPTMPVRAGTSTIMEVDSEHGGRANSWHTDITFSVAPPAISILRAVVVPPYGGDTAWANTAAAYQELPPALRALADTLWAVHANDYDYAATRVTPDAHGAKRYQEVFTRRLIQAEHPLVRVHPETGERSLLVGHFVKRLSGVSGVDSQRIVELLQSHVTRLENTVRWHWTQGDVAIWDNRATQHYAINDYGDAKRTMRRVTLSGEVPVAVDGRRSRAHGPSAAREAGGANLDALLALA